MKTFAKLSLRSRWVITLAIVGLSSFTCRPLFAASVDRPEATIQDGFYLLMDTSKKEEKLHLLPIFKTTPPEIVAYMKHISEAANVTFSTMSELQNDDPSLKPEANPLPLIEQQTRTSIADVSQHKLLFETKGAPYVRVLLLNQIEASNYVGTLAQVMSDSSSNPKRIRALNKIAVRWFKVRDEGFQLLNGVR